MTATFRSDRPTGIGWVLWIAAATLPWLQPVHEHPWPAFYSEALAAAVMVPIALWVLWKGHRDGWALDGASATLLAAAVVSVAQIGLGLYVFPGEAWLVALYLTGLSVTVMVARNAQRSAPLMLADALFASLAIASLASAGMMFYQWTGQDWLGAMVPVARSAGRVQANLGQPNNAATLLCWGMIAIWWGFARGKVGRFPAVLAIGFLLVALALTRSRTGWLEVAVLAAAAIHWRRRAALAPALVTVAALAAAFVLVAASLDHLTRSIDGGTTEAMRAQWAAGRRPLIWRLALDEIVQRPWFGYGWNQGVPAHMQVVEQSAGVQTTVQHAHSVVLDLMVWNGVPIALLLMSAIGYWAIRQWRACQTDHQRLLLLALLILLVHALLELPHAYLFFLLPAALMMGTLSAMEGETHLLAVPRAVAAVVTVGLAASIAIAFDDYRQIERDAMAAKLRAANIHNPSPTSPPNPLILGYLQTALQQLRAEPSDGSAADLAALRRTLERYPSLGGMVRYAQSSALHQKPREASWALTRLCLLNDRPTCETVLQGWRDMARTSPAMAAVELPAVP